MVRASPGTTLVLFLLTSFPCIPYHLVVTVSLPSPRHSLVPRSCREDWRKNDDKVNGKGTRDGCGMGGGTVAHRSFRRLTPLFLPLSRSLRSLLSTFASCHSYPRSTREVRT